MDQWKTLCSDCYGPRLGLEFGVNYGGSVSYVGGNCQLSSSADTTGGCDGQNANLDANLDYTPE